MAEHPYNQSKEALEIAQRAFDELKAAAFWNWRPQTKISYQNLSLIIPALRENGGRRGYLYAEAIQRELSREKPQPPDLLCP
jgi:hypothetical protein